MQIFDTPPRSIAASATVSLLAATLLTGRLAVADTYTVTSAFCTGAGSFVEAMNLANNNPGTDTIAFQAGLTVDANGCPELGTDPSDYYIARATESVNIVGNGAVFEGSQAWVNSDGRLNPPHCPQDESGTVVAAIVPGFIAVGEVGSDNSGVEVSVDGLTIKGLSAVAVVLPDASFTLSNASVQNIDDIYDDCDRPAIRARPGANVTIRSSDLIRARNWGTLPLAPIFVGAVAGAGGTLNVYDARFVLNQTIGAIYWGDGNANIVSSYFGDTGGISYGGSSGTEMNIVNTVFQSTTGFQGGPQDRIYAFGADAVVNIIASTITALDTSCRGCESPYENGMPLFADLGTINLVESAVGVGISTGISGDVLAVNSDFGGTYTADAKTWVQPVDDQDAAALRTLTGQPSLLTDPPGLPTAPDDFLPPSNYTPLIGTTGSPGVLIDVIADADCPSGTGRVSNPIDGSCITEDALGNSRWDTGNLARNIGAVQMTLAPHLTLDSVGSNNVGLSWSRPLDPVSGPITGYEICYAEDSVTPPDPEDACPGTTIPLSGANSTAEVVSGLTGGVTYWFVVRATESGAQLPWSNLVTATPTAPPNISAPGVTATPSVCQTEVSWTAPSTGADLVAYYFVRHRVVGDTAWIADSVFPADQLETNVTGLSGETAYEFEVQPLTSSLDNGTPGMTQATTTMAGDIDVSGTVTFNLDRPLFVAANGSSEGDTRYEPNADLDCDGRVTAADYRLWYKGWIADGRPRAEP